MERKLARAGLFLPLLIGFAPLSAHAQGRSFVALPQLDRTAQSFALGNDGATLQGLNALGINPAGLNTRAPEVMSQYQQLPLDTNLALLGASYHLQGIDTTMAITYTGLRSTSFDGRDANGNALGSFVTQDDIIGLHLSRALNADSPVTLGVSVKLLQMSVQNTAASAVAVDLGGRYAFSQMPVTVGLSAVNLGKGPVMDQQQSQLPASYILSAAYRLNEGLDILSNYAINSNQGTQALGFGFQYTLGNMFTLRGNYSMSRESSGEAAGVQNLAAGVGFKIFGRDSIDYTFQPFDSSLQQAGASGTQRVTLTMRFAEQGAAPATPWLGQGRAYPAYSEEAGERGSKELARESIRAAENGRFSMAAVRMQQAVDADPNNRSAKAMLPRVKAVAAIIPDTNGLEGPMAFVARGATMFIEGQDPNEAAIFLRQAFDQDKTNDRILSLLNYVEKSAAGATLTQRAGEDPTRSLVDRKVQEARQLIYDSNYKQAIHRAQEALDLDPKNVAALELIGSGYYMLGDRKTANATWLRALELDPNNATIKEFLSQGPLE